MKHSEQGLVSPGLQETQSPLKPEITLTFGQAFMLSVQFHQESKTTAIENQSHPSLALNRLESNSRTSNFQERSFPAHHPAARTAPGRSCGGEVPRRSAVSGSLSSSSTKGRDGYAKSESSSGPQAPGVAHGLVTSHSWGVI